MNFLAWMLALGMITTTSYEAVVFYQATVCRQSAWLKGTELQTRTLLHRSLPFEKRFDPGCKLIVARNHQKISWQRLPNLKAHSFHLPLQGKL